MLLLTPGKSLSMKAWRVLRVSGRSIIPCPRRHASVSCKWTPRRSDRAQNARSEGLNLVRNRKGRLPHIAVVTGEPTPYRIASIALGTGDIDCVYHFALPELVDTVKALGYADSEDLLNTMIEGKRLRDIADLPLELGDLMAYPAHPSVAISIQTWSVMLKKPG